MLSLISSNFHYHYSFQLSTALHILLVAPCSPWSLEAYAVNYVLSVLVLSYKEIHANIAFSMTLLVYRGGK